MTQIPDSHRDLLEALVATLATIGPDGRPQLSEVWFLAEGDTLALSLNISRQKTKHLMVRPQCCLFILDLAVPQRYLEIRGDAEVTPDEDYSFAEHNPVSKAIQAMLDLLDEQNVGREAETL